MSPSAVSADYVDLKFIKSRSVAQVVLEIPIEAAEAFVAAFGTPRPAEGVPCALARLETGKPLKAQPPMAKRLMADLPLPQQSALLCNRQAFWRYVSEKLGIPTRNEEEAVVFLRRHCQVASRSDIRHAHISGALFLNLKHDFDTWMKVDA